MNTATSGTVLDFSLARSDPLFRLQQKLGLIPPGGQGLVRRAVFWSMLGWLPIAVWAFFVNRALPGEVQEPLLAHFGVHARLLVAVPLLIIAEGPASAMLSGMLHHFAGSGIVPHTQRALFEAAVRGAVRMRDATLPWVVIAAIVLAIVTYTSFTERAHEADWAHAEAGTPGLGFGGLWFLYVGRSIYLALVLVWLWRIVVVAVLMWRVARLELSLVPTHPDRVGGLAFLERLPTGFAPVAFAAGCVLASRWAHDAVYHGLTLTSLRVEMVGFILLCVVTFSLPLLAFRGPLKRLKKQALLEYSDLVARQGRLVHRRWIEGREVGQPPILAAPELGPVADTAAMYDAVRSMRSLPLGKSAMLTVGLAAALPIIGVLALQIPFKQLVLTLMKAVL